MVIPRKLKQDMPYQGFGTYDIDPHYLLGPWYINDNGIIKYKLSEVIHWECSLNDNSVMYWRATDLITKQTVLIKTSHEYVQRPTEYDILSSHNTTMLEVNAPIHSKFVPICIDHLEHNVEQVGLGTYKGLKIFDGSKFVPLSLDKSTHQRLIREVTHLHKQLRISILSHFSAP